MALYSSCPFVYEDSEWELQTFVREDMFIDGGLAMDDSGHFLIQAISGEDSYVFLDETIQLGVRRMTSKAGVDFMYSNKVGER